MLRCGYLLMLKRLAGIRFYRHSLAFCCFFLWLNLTHGDVAFYCLLCSLSGLGFGWWWISRRWKDLTASHCIFLSSEWILGRGRCFSCRSFWSEAARLRSRFSSVQVFSPRSFFYPVLLSCAPTVFDSVVDLRFCRSCVIVVMWFLLCYGGKGEEERRRKNGKRRRADGSFLFLLLSYVSYTVYHLIIPYYSLALFTSLISLTYI